MTHTIEDFKAGDLVQISRDLDTKNPEIQNQSPGWFPDEMDYLLGRTVEVTEIEDYYMTVVANDGNQWFIIPDWVSNKRGRKGQQMDDLPKKDDWVIYYESEEDREIATIGQVTGFNEKEFTWEIDGCGGFRNVVKFKSIKTLEKVRSGKEG